MHEVRKTTGEGGVKARLAVAACTAVFATGLPALETTGALPDASYQRWNGALDQRTLGDGSVLSAYTAYTTAVDSVNATLRIGFLPRFGCSPTIGIHFGGAMASAIEAFFEDGDSLTLAIDDNPIEWPLLVDADGVTTTLWLNGEAERRDRVRRRLDAGSRVSLSLPNTLSMTFSLLGSRSSIEDVEKACLSHEPIPWNG